LAAPSIRAGINQTIMLSLAMVVVASLIGAKGLGEDVLEALQYANVGQGILAGFSILFCAMILDRIVLLDFGATQPIAPTLVAQFRALAGVALGGDAGQTRAALLGMGYMGPDTAAHHQALIQQMFDLATAPLRQEAGFDFGATDLLERLRDMGLAIGTERELAHVPPPETLFVHRKIGGMYLLATTLRAKLALRPMIAAHATGACTV